MRISLAQGLVGTASAVALLRQAGVAAACTLCHSETAAEVRARLLSEDPLSNLAALAVPLPLILAALLVLALPREPRG